MTAEPPEFVPPGDESPRELPPEPPPLPPTAPGWRDLGIALALIWCVELVLGVVFVVSQVVSTGFDAAELPVPPPELLIPLTLISSAFCMGVVWHFACRKYRKGLREGLRITAAPPRALGASVGLGLGCALVATVLMYLFSTGESFLEDLLIQEDEAATPKFVVAFAVLFLVLPVFEEVYYRGFLFPIFRRLLGVRWAFATIVVWFGLVHAPQLAGDWAGLPVVTAMGALWTYLRIRYDSIVPCMVSHFTYNLVLLGISGLAMMVGE